MPDPLRRNIRAVALGVGAAATLLALRVIEDYHHSEARAAMDRQVLTYEFIAAVGNTREWRGQLEALAREYVFTGDSATAARARDIGDQIQVAFAAARTRAAALGLESKVDTLAAVVRPLVAQFTRLMTVRRESGHVAAERFLHNIIGQHLSDSAAALSMRFRQEQFEGLRAAAARLDRLQRRIGFFDVGGSALVMLFGWLVVRGMRKEENMRAAAQAREIEAAAQFRTLTDRLPDAVLLLQDGRVAFANREAARILGVGEPDALLGRTPLEFAHPDSREAVRRFMAALAQGAEVPPAEHVWLRPDGSGVCVEVVGAPATFNGRPAAQVVGRDITERKTAESRLSDLRRRHEQFLNAVAEGIHVVAPDGTISFENAASARMFGFAPGEMLGMPAHATIHHHRADGAEYPVELCPIDATLGDGQAREVRDDVFWRRDGTAFPVEYTVAPVPDAAGGRNGVIVAFRDMTARRKAEADLDHFFAISLDIMCISSADGYFKRMNPAVTRVLGWTAEEMPARPFMEFIHPDDVGPTIGAVDQLVARGEQVLHFENRYRHKDGSYRVIAWNATPQPGGFMYGVGRDVTEARAAEALLRAAYGDLSRANAELARASRTKDEFLANMSHELRTPLNAILGLSETLLELDAASLTPRQVKSIETIAASGRHLLELINDILDLSKVEAAKLELQPAAIDVREFSESCLAFVRSQAIAKRIQIAFESDGRTARITADPRRLKQMLVNLLANAVKFTPSGGRAGLVVETSDDAHAIRFTVWDTGIGIAPGDMQRLFKPFVQLDAGLNRTEHGTGLGLALVAKLAELHGGSIALESEPGKGSRFTVTLPLVDTPAPAATPADAGVATQTRKRPLRALIIDDDPTSAALLDRYLRDLDVGTTLHATGEHAVEAVEREQPEIIFLDILLPGESGWVILARLKEHPALKDIPVVVISVMDEPAKARAMGAAAHLTKPVTRADLAAVLQMRVPERAAPPAAAMPPVDGRPHRTVVLLAEDHPANVQTIGGYLEAKGYAMRYAETGLEAIELARTVRPAVVLMDIQMPVMDGLAATVAIRSDPTIANIPIVALTALAMAGDRERCLAAGATEYMTKPVNLKELEATVSRLAAAPRTAPRPS